MNILDDREKARIELWIKVYTESREAEIGYGWAEGTAADKALAQFDKRFPKQEDWKAKYHDEVGRRQALEARYDTPKEEIQALGQDLVR